MDTIKIVTRQRLSVRRLAEGVTSVNETCRRRKADTGFDACKRRFETVLHAPCLAAGARTQRRRPK